MQYRVRQGFVLHRPDRPPAVGGTIVDLTAAEFEQYAHQLEPYEVIPLTEPPPIVPDPETIPQDVPVTDYGNIEAEPTEPETPKRRARKKEPEA